MDSPGWIVICAPKVNSFRKTLPPAEAELFIECLIRVCRNPEPDKIHTFILRTRPPAVDFIYRDGNFVLLYYWTRITQPYIALKITVFKATRTRDFYKDSGLPMS